MGFALIFMAVMSVVTTVLTALSARANQPKASSLGSFQAPTAEEGRVIPVVFGTVLLRGANVTWYGDLYAKPIKPKTAWWQLLVGGLVAVLGNALSPAYAYRYFLGVHVVLCHGPVDDLVNLGFVSSQSGTHVG